MSDAEPIPARRTITVDGTNATFLRHLQLVKDMVADTPGTDEQPEEVNEAVSAMKKDGKL